MTFNGEYFPNWYIINIKVVSILTFSSLKSYFTIKIKVTYTCIPRFEHQTNKSLLINERHCFFLFNERVHYLNFQYYSRNTIIEPFHIFPFSLWSQWQNRDLYLINSKLNVICIEIFVVWLIVSIQIMALYSVILLVLYELGNFLLSCNSLITTPHLSMTSIIL